MGFRKPNFNQAKDVLRGAIAEISSPYNDGFTSSYCKEELYMLKCWLEYEYSKLPTFVGEEKWEQERLIHVLKQ